jgi:hypothetical protein
MDFIIDNLVWFIVAGIVILMTIIGYFAEKTNFGKNTPESENENEDTNVEKVEKEKPNKKEKKHKHGKDKDAVANIDESSINHVDNVEMPLPLITEEPAAEFPIVNDEVNPQNVVPYDTNSGSDLFASTPLETVQSDAIVATDDEMKEEPSEEKEVNYDIANYTDFPKTEEPINVNEDFKGNNEEIFPVAVEEPAVVSTPVVVDDVEQPVIEPVIEEPKFEENSLFDIPEPKIETKPLDITNESDLEDPVLITDEKVIPFDELMEDTQENEDNSDPILSATMELPKLESIDKKDAQAAEDDIWKF